MEALPSLLLLFILYWFFFRSKRNALPKRPSKPGTILSSKNGNYGTLIYFETALDNLLLEKYPETPTRDFETNLWFSERFNQFFAYPKHNDDKDDTEPLGRLPKQFSKQLLKFYRKQELGIYILSRFNKDTRIIQVEVIQKIND